MTAPVNAEDLFYFDGRTKRFFSSKPSLTDPLESELYDMVGLTILPSLSGDMRERLADIDFEHS